MFSPCKLKMYSGQQIFLVRVFLLKFNNNKQLQFLNFLLRELVNNDEEYKPV